MQKPLILLVIYISLARVSCAGHVLWTLETVSDQGPPVWLRYTPGNSAKSNENARSEEGLTGRGDGNNLAECQIIFSALTGSTRYSSRSAVLLRRQPLRWRCIPRIRTILSFGKNPLCW